MGEKMKLSQGRRLIAHLRRKPHTYLEMQSLGISTSPQKRVVEALRENEQIVKGKRHMGGSRYLTTWRVIAATNWTA
jgi:hypothetical protein